MGGEMEGTFNVGIVESIIEQSFPFDVILRTGKIKQITLFYRLFQKNCHLRKYTYTGHSTYETKMVKQFPKKVS